MVEMLDPRSEVSQESELRRTSRGSVAKGLRIVPSPIEAHVRDSGDLRRRMRYNEKAIVEQSARTEEYEIKEVKKKQYIQNLEVRRADFRRLFFEDVIQNERRKTLESKLSSVHKNREFGQKSSLT